MITEAQYRQFQHQLAANKTFRYVWQFWSNYAFVFFVIAAFIIMNEPALLAVKKPIAILSAVSFFITRGMVIPGFNIFFERKRPYQIYGFLPITSKFFSFKTKIANSFPSRHTAVYFTVATIVSLFVPALGAILIIVSILTAIARIILGYHWLSDVVAGAIVGIIVGLFTAYIGYPAVFT